MRTLISLMLVSAAPASADPVTIVESRVEGTRVSVTLAHPDTGWDHYADGWRIEDGDGNILGTRELLHPHVNEQPFTRSLTISDLPDGDLFVRAKCSVDGWGEETVSLNR